MYKIYTIVAAAALLLTTVCGSIQFIHSDEDKPVTNTTFSLLFSLKNCIVFIFDWSFDNFSDPSTSTNYFVFYSKSLSCSIVVETCMEYRNKTLENPRFKTYHPHPLFTKYTTNLINLYSSGATSIDVEGKPATAYIPEVIGLYNIPFNYVLLFMSKERFSSVNMNAMFSKFLRACAPAVYIMVLDEEEVNIVGFGHVLQSAPYLFQVNTLQESHFQRLHETVHKDLQHSKIAIFSKSSPKVCKLGWKINVSANGCTLGWLIENYNMTYGHCSFSSCPRQRITAIKSHQELRAQDHLTRRTSGHSEFINYFHYYYEFSFFCLVETSSKGFMAFVQAFDLSTWVVTAAACSGLSVTVAATSTKQANSLWTKLQPSTVVVLMLLFDRFHANKKLQLAASKQTAVVLTLWAFGAMLLGMSYSGKMISEFTAPSLPPVPQDMHELSLVRYPILTTEFITVGKNGKATVQGHIHHKIISYLQDNPGQNSTLINDLRRLKSAVTLIDEKRLRQHHNISSPKSSKVLFAYADKPARVKAAMKWSGMLSSSLRTSPLRNLPFFNNQNQMILLSNSLLPIFRKFLAHTCENGFITYWKGCNDAENSRRFIHEHFKIFTLLSQSYTTTMWETKKSRINLATIWRDFGVLLESTTSWNQITLHTLNPAFQLFGVGLLISTLVLFHERCPLHKVCRKLLHKFVDVLFSVGKWFQW